MKRKAGHRDQKVNKVRGPAFEEAAQQVRKEAEEAKQEATCPSTMQVEPSPFPEAPASGTVTTDEVKGETSEMEL